MYARTRHTAIPAVPAYVAPVFRREIRKNTEPQLTLRIAQELVAAEVS